MASLTLSLIVQASLVAAIPGNDYEEAYRMSQVSGKPLVVFVGADWCPGCQKMKGRVLPELRKKGLFNRVEFAHVNTDRQSKLASRLMSGGTIPQLILYHMTSQGWKREQITGARSLTDVQTFLERGIAEAQVASNHPSNKSKLAQ